MQKVSKNTLLSIATRLLILLLLAKIISLALWWYLPSEGVELNAQKSYKAKYQRVDFANMLSVARVVAAPKVAQKSAANINTLILKGLYGNRYEGYAIVAKKSTLNKTSIVAVGEIYEGYKLKEIASQKVIFTKGTKEYILALYSSDKLDTSKVLSKADKSRVTSYAPVLKNVRKQDINFYAKNPHQIWKEIAITEVRKRGKIDGFEVKKIKKGSRLAALGLEVGDVIIRANNIELKSYNEAIRLYKDIDNINTLELVVRRNNQEKEIIYEIH